MPPPSGPPPGAETLEYGGGGPIPPSRGPRTKGGRRKWFLLAGGVVGIGAIGAAAFGAWWYVATGPQPAEALPAGTLAYASIDLDPSGQQKLDALGTLRKLPVIDEEFDLGGDLGDIDIKQVLAERILADAPCELDYEADVASWLGDRGAVAAVETGEGEPTPVFVLQVSDPDAAVDGFGELAACGNEGDPEIGTEIVGDDWLLIAETPELAAEVAEATADGSLADDETFRTWTDAAGDPGVVSLYAAPAAGAFLAENFEDLFGPMNVLPGISGEDVPGLMTPEDFENLTPEELEGIEEYFGTGAGADPAVARTTSDELTDDMTGELTKAFEDFEGMAVTIRFGDGAMEVEAAAGAGTVDDQLPQGRGSEALESLPEDTAAALGFGFGEGWFDQVLTSVASSLGENPDTLVSDLESLSGLSLPEDAETLAGEAIVLAIGGDFDLGTVEESQDGSDIPVALKVLGDPDAISGVLDKIRPQLVEQGAPEELLASSSEGDATAVGPSEDYREQVLGDGGLGDSDRYRDVVPDDGDAAGVLFLDLDAIVDLVDDAGGMGDDDEVRRNLEPLRALGMSAWLDDDGTSHTRLRISTDD